VQLCGIAATRQECWSIWRRSFWRMLIQTEFMVPLDTMVRSRFVTGPAAARQMVKKHSGIVILVTGSPALPHPE
jgi:hypothetical protein